MGGLIAAEADSQAAYLGAIRALAAALDARDPYTAGHSERVSTLSVLVRRAMRLEGADLRRSCGSAPCSTTSARSA